MLMPFANSAHAEMYTKHRIDVAVIAFGGDATLVAAASRGYRGLRMGRDPVANTQGTRRVGARNGVFAQGDEAGGHLAGRCQVARDY